MPTIHGPETGFGQRSSYVPAGAWSKCSTIVEQNARRSDGDRLVTRFRSTTTSSSTTLAPALRRSVRMLGYEVSVLPATTPASTSVQGPWQMAATNFPELT